MQEQTQILERRLTPPRHELWATIETVIRSQCRGKRKPPGFKHASTRTYHIPAGGDLIVQVYPKNCMIAHGGIVFDDIPRDQILLFLRAFITEKKLKHN
jgi:hypothetical protein